MVVNEQDEVKLSRLVDSESAEVARGDTRHIEAGTYYERCVHHEGHPCS